MDESAKLYVGGIAWATKEDTLRDYFSKYGEVKKAMIVKDKTNGYSRGFGFVIFSEPSILDVIVKEKHAIDGRGVDVKKALSREEKQNHSSGDSDANRNRNFSGSGSHRTQRIYIGGLPSTLTQVEFTQYFQNYGGIIDTVIMIDQITGRPRGFGFITFDTEDAVDRVLGKTFHKLNGKLVVVKRAIPREASPGRAAHGRNSSYYSPYGTNSHLFGNQMEGSNFSQFQPAAGGYLMYPGYGALGYGYGLTSNGTLYGSYGFGGYGNVNAGYTGSYLVYGNQPAGNTKVLNSYAGLDNIGHWSRHPQGTGAFHYSINAGYGATIPWGTALPDHSKSGIHGSGNQGDQHSSYHGSDVSYTGSCSSRTASRRNTSPNAAETGQQGANNI